MVGCTGRSSVKEDTHRTSSVLVEKWTDSILEMRRNILLQYNYIYYYSELLRHPCKELCRQRLALR